MPETINTLAQIIWDYHHMNHQLAKADAIVVLGSHDVRVADRGIEIFKAGWAPLLVFSGGFGNFTKNIWKQTEAETFAERARAAGIPAEKIWIENQSSNTGENIHFTRRLFKQKELHPRRLIAVQKPYMERRTYATFRKIWPEIDIIITSPQIEFADYTTPEITRDQVINIMVGDLQRIKIYPNKGFQIPQTIPPAVWDTYEKLVRLGYTKHLLPN